MISSQVRPSQSSSHQAQLPSLPQESTVLVAPLLSGLSFLAMHGYHRRGMEISLSCRFMSPTSTSMTLEVYPEGTRSFDLEGISFRVRVDGEKANHRVVTLDKSGHARVEGVPRMARVILELAADR